MKGVVEHLLYGGLNLPCPAVVYGIGYGQSHVAVTVLGVIRRKERMEIGSRDLVIGEELLL